jgi:hypothetical protein
MDGQLQLKVSFDAFQNEVNELVKKGQSIFESTASNTEDEKVFEEIKLSVDNWIADVKKFLKAAFNQENNYIFIEFHNSMPSEYSIPGHAKKVSDRLKSKREHLSYKIQYLINEIKVIKVCDKLANHPNIDLSERENFDTEQKLIFILSKLYDLKGDGYYSIKELMLGNGLVMTNSDEDRDFADVLEQNSYIETQGNRDILAKITTMGRLFIEKLKKGKSGFDFVANDIDF